MTLISALVAILMTGHRAVDPAFPAAHAGYDHRRRGDHRRRHPDHALHRHVGDGVVPARLYAAWGSALALVASIALVGCGGAGWPIASGGGATSCWGRSGSAWRSFSVHFLAMAGTRFPAAMGSLAAAGPADGQREPGNARDAQRLCHLGGVPADGHDLCAGSEETVATAPPDASDAGGRGNRGRAAVSGNLSEAPAPRIPYEREDRIFFLDGSAVAALRAEGHYTIAYHGTEQLFCPWSISEAEKRLGPWASCGCIAVICINPRLVSGFERLKDTGLRLLRKRGRADEGARQPVAPRRGARGAWAFSRFAVRAGNAQFVQMQARFRVAAAVRRAVSVALPVVKCARRPHGFGRST